VPSRPRRDDARAPSRGITRDPAPVARPQAPSDAQLPHRRRRRRARRHGRRRAAFDRQHAAEAADDAAAGRRRQRAVARRRFRGDAAALERGSYSATTPEEIQAKKDEEAAKAAAAARIAAAATTASSDYTGSLAETIAPAGSVVRPLPFFNNFGEPYAGHKGTDYMVDRGTPIYAIADGVVVASTRTVPGGASTSRSPTTSAVRA
jgi:murein DD-endopeptidase MepM/ murein hydrolase activator NlpD